MVTNPCEFLTKLTITYNQFAGFLANHLRMSNNNTFKWFQTTSSSQIGTSCNIEYCRTGACVFDGLQAINKNKNILYVNV